MIVLSEPEQVGGGFQFVEGPVWLSSDNPLVSLTGESAACLIFSDIPASRLHWYRAGQMGVVREATGQVNGNTLDIDGSLLSCEHQRRCVSRLTGDGSVRMVIDRFEGKRLNSPNDVVVRSDGLVFFTDPPYGVSDNERELDYQGIYCLDPESLQLTLIRNDFDKPNGLAFSVDERELFIADTQQGRLRQFRVEADGSLSHGQIFCECERPDGIRLDQAGNVWVACFQGIEVFAPDGRRIAFARLPERPANLVFGDNDLQSIYVCACTSIYKIRSTIAGAVRPACG